MQRHGGLYTLDDRQAQGTPHSLDGRLAIAVVDDQFGDHRVVVRKHFAFRVSRCIDAHAWSSRKVKGVDCPRRWCERNRVLGIDPTLDTCTVEGDFFLRIAERLSRRDADLLFDEIDAGDHFRHRMLHLDARVHLHEVELPVLIQQKLDGAGIDVVYGARSIHRQTSHFLSQAIRYRRRR